MERKLTSGKWETLRPATLLDPFLVEIQLDTLAFAPVFLDFSQNYFDRLAVSKTLEPGDSMFGWTFIKGKPAQFLPSKSRWWPPAALWSWLIGANEVRLVIYDTLGGVTKLDVDTNPTQDPRVSLAASKDLKLIRPMPQFWAHAKVKCED
jgi:hypothetical protein